MSDVEIMMVMVMVMMGRYVRIIYDWVWMNGVDGR
jgi:hypothetical protein